MARITELGGSKMKYLIMLTIAMPVFAHKPGDCAYSKSTETTSKIEDVGTKTVTLSLIKTKSQSVEDLHKAFAGGKIAIEKARFEEYWEIVECPKK